VLPDASASRSTAHTFVLDALRDAILSGSLPAGARLIQTEIAARLEVRTTPVREAIRDLVCGGISTGRWPLCCGPVENRWGK
jgi:DNA-binding GntR family transcriptional regulator